MFVAINMSYIVIYKRSVSIFCKNKNFISIKHHINIIAFFYKKLLLNTRQLCCGDENSIAEGEKVCYSYWVWAQ